MKTIDLLMDELRSMESEHQLRYESLCRLLNYWYPILGYDSANEMSYPAWGDSRARPAPYIAQLEAALVEAEAGRLHLYKEMLRLDNPPDTDECPQCGGKVEGTYSTWYECWEADMNHDEDCPLEIAHNALGRRWTDESFAQAKQKLEDLTKLQNGAE